MKKFVLGIVTLFISCVTSAEITIYYDNSETNFSPLQVELEYVDGSRNVTKSHVNMTRISRYIYSVTIPDTTEKLFFYNGGNESNNQTQSIGTYYLAPLINGNIYQGTAPTEATYGWCRITNLGTCNLYRVYVYASDENDADDKFLFAEAEDAGGYTHSPAMEYTGQYVRKNNKYYRCWRYIQASETLPSTFSVKTATENGTELITAAKFEDGAFYQIGNTTPTREELVDKDARHEMTSPDGSPNILYCHFKTDRLNFGGRNIVPKCHLFNQTTGEEMYSFGDRTEEMVKITDTSLPGTTGAITDTYDIWKFEIPMEDFAAGKYDCAIFYLDKNNQWPINEALGAHRNDYLKNNWTKYIYSTANDQGSTYAAPSYVSYNDFITLHKQNVAAKGLTQVFITGPQNKFVWYDENDQEQSFNGYDLLNCQRLTEDHGVFYLKVRAADESIDTENGCQGNTFKLSWIDVRKYHDSAMDAEGSRPENSGAQALDAHRQLATFYLGSVGVDESVIGEDYAPAIGRFGRAKLSGKIALTLKYSYKNQCDWLIDESLNSDPRYIFLDTHFDPDDPDYQCQSITLTGYIPVPSMDAAISNVRHVNLSESDYTIVGEVPELKASSANGEVPLDASIADATVSINFSYPRNFSHMTPGYEVTYKNGFIDKKKDVGKMSFDYNTTTTSHSYSYNYAGFPFDPEKGILRIRARFLNENSGQSFHSLFGDVKLLGLSAFTAPENVDVYGKYIEEQLVVPQSDTDKAERTFGALVRNFNNTFDESFTCTSPDGTSTGGKLAAYADYEVLDNDGNNITKQCELFKGSGGNSLIEERIGQNFNDKTYSELCWDDGGHWSTTLKQTARGEEVPLYFRTITPTPVADIKELGERHYTILLHAIYPILYNNNLYTEATQKAKPASTDIQLAAEAAEVPVQKIDHVRKTNKVDLYLRTDQVITGIDEVPEDVENQPTEYYTVSGIRVQGDPAPGIYIVRQGKNVRKEVIK